MFVFDFKNLKEIIFILLTYAVYFFFINYKIITLYYRLEEINDYFFKVIFLIINDKYLISLK